MPQPEIAQPELELTEGETPAAPVRPKQVIVIDGEALQYETSISWEVFPANLELLLDDKIFEQNATFSCRLTPEVEQSRAVDNAIERIWQKFDADKSGKLDRAETRKFLDAVLMSTPNAPTLDDSTFNELFV